MTKRDPLLMKGWFSARDQLPPRQETATPVWLFRVSHSTMSGYYEHDKMGSEGRFVDPQGNVIPDVTQWMIRSEAKESSFAGFRRPETDVPAVP